MAAVRDGVQTAAGRQVRFRPPQRGTAMARALPASVVGFAVYGALLTCAASTTSADARQQPLTRTFFASVVAKDGTPVTDLTAADIEVKEGGKLQSITSMRITTMPLRLHIIVSDGGTGAFQLGVLRLAQTLARSGRVEFAFTSVLIQPTRVTDFTDDVEAIGAGIEKLGRRSSVQGGSQLMEAIVSAVENIAAPGKRPVLIVLRIGNEGISPISANSVREALRRTGTTLYVVSRAGASKAAPTYSGSGSTTGEVAQRQMDDAERADTSLNLNLVLGDGSRESGGYHQEIVLTTTVATLEQLASQIKNQYEITYTLPAGVKPSDRLQVTAKRKGVTLRAPAEDSQLTVEVPVEGLASVSKGVSMSSVRRRYLGLASAGLLAVAGCSGGAPEWAAKNQRVIDQHKVTGRTRDVPAVTVPNVLVPGVPVENATLPTATLAPGVVARLAWGRGALLEQVDMQPGATLPEQTLGEELILLGRDGSATIEFDGKTVDVARDSVLYLQPGAKTLGQGRAERVESVRSLLADSARSSRAGRPEHVGRERDVPGPGCDAVAPAGRGRELQRHPVDAADQSRSVEIVPAKHGALAAHLGQECPDQFRADGSRRRVPAAHSPGRSADAHRAGQRRSGRDGRDDSRLGRGRQHALRAGGHGPLGEAGASRSRSARRVLARAARLHRTRTEAAGTLRPGRPRRRQAREAGRRVHVRRRPDLAQGPALLLGHVLRESGRGRLDRQPGQEPAHRHDAGRQVARARRAACSRTAPSPQPTATSSSATCSVTASSKWTRRAGAWCVSCSTR